jgi:hypothetical protein
MVYDLFNGFVVNFTDNVMGFTDPTWAYLMEVGSCEPPAGHGTIYILTHHDERYYLACLKPPEQADMAILDMLLKCREQHRIPELNVQIYTQSLMRVNPCFHSRQNHLTVS